MNQCVICGRAAHFQVGTHWACEKHASASDDTYMEILDTRTGDYRKTGQGAIMQSPVHTWMAFQDARKLHKPGAPFVLDLYVDDNLTDTIEIDAAAFRTLTGETPKAPEEYAAYDEAYWKGAER